MSFEHLQEHDFSGWLEVEGQIVKHWDLGNSDLEVLFPQTPEYKDVGRGEIAFLIQDMLHVCFQRLTGKPGCWGEGLPHRQLARVELNLRMVLGLEARDWSCQDRSLENGRGHQQNSRHRGEVDVWCFHLGGQKKKSGGVRGKIIKGRRI